MTLQLGEWAHPQLGTLPLPEEYAGLLRPDEELFWSLRPGITMTYRDVTVRTNPLGLRGPEVPAKEADEFRILSLGESSTFGVGVRDDETYSYLLQKELERHNPQRRWRVINAGVSAYSSFQSLQYFKKRGRELSPDMVLFYHEVNDYLPSTFRDSSHDERGIALSDWKLYESRTGAASRHLLAHSALFRFISYQSSLGKIRRMQRTGASNPLLQIGLPDIGLPARVVLVEGADQAESSWSGRALPTRVTPAERKMILDELRALCRRQGIELVVIHPSYRNSRPHQCLLTEFCLENKVPMLDAYEALHPPGVSTSRKFLDGWHPTAEGHRRLAVALAQFLLEFKLLE